MYTDKINLIQSKITGLLNKYSEMETERENLLNRIRVLEEELKTERSGTGRSDKKSVTVQHSETVKAPTLFDDLSTKDLKEKLDNFIDDIDQCIEIIEK